MFVCMCMCVCVCVVRGGVVIFVLKTYVKPCIRLDRLKFVGRVLRSSRLHDIMNMLGFFYEWINKNCSLVKLQVYGPVFDHIHYPSHLD